MGSMADEMRARMEADGGAGLPDGGGDGGAAPGNAGDPPNQAAPAAGPSTTETAPGSGTPDTIPYARFKEVNDRYNGLKDFEELVGYGYDADSLRRLAAFESSYLQDPLGTLATMADNLDLPQETIDAIKAHAETLGGNGRAEGEPSAGSEQPPALPKEVQERLDYVDRLRARDEDNARQAQLDAVVEAWDRMDKEDKIATPERIKLMAIASVANSGESFRTYEDLAAAAREVINEFRGETLGSAVQTRTGRGGGAPPALPSGAPPSSGPIRFKDLRDASRAAEADIVAGKLPPIQS